MRTWTHQEMQTHTRLLITHYDFQASRLGLSVNLRANLLGVTAPAYTGWTKRGLPCANGLATFNLMLLIPALTQIQGDAVNRIAQTPERNRPHAVRRILADLPDRA